MFTGLVSDVGEVISINGASDDLVRLEIRSTHFASFSLGESIACNGVCLTVTRFSGTHFFIDAAPETLRRTTIGQWGVGHRVNLEQALKAGDRLGGHMVQGHVDAIAKLIEKRNDGGSLWLTLTLAKELSGLLVEKGSICIDGISLTITSVTADSFSVMLIPETVAKTTLGTRRVGQYVNLEVDIIGKYVAKMIALRFP